MKWLASQFLEPFCRPKAPTLASLALILSSAAAIVDAQLRDAQPLPDVSTLIQQTILQQRLAEARERDYLFREHVTLNKLRKECTWAPQCPGRPSRAQPIGLGYQVLHYTGLEFEIFGLDGIRVAREMPTCQRCPEAEGRDDLTQKIPISESELAAENQGLDNEIATARALREQGKNPGSPKVPPQILFSRMLELCSFSNPRRQVAEDRTDIWLDFTCDSSAQTLGGRDGIVNSFSGSVAIDEADRAIQRVDGKFLADVNLEGGNIKIRKGTRVTVENVRLEPGMWELSKLNARGEGRYFALTLDGDGYIFAGQYRKFDATSRILSVSPVPDR